MKPATAGVNLQPFALFLMGKSPPEFRKWATGKRERGSFSRRLRSTLGLRVASVPAIDHEVVKMSFIRNVITQRDEIISKYGPWTAHNIKLADEVFTIKSERGEEEGSVGHRADYFVQLSCGMLRRPIQECSVLDIGSLEGGITIRFGQRGASACGLEIRDEHLAKSNFAKQVLGLDKVRFVKGDMLDLDAAIQDEVFDVIVCAGTLYHVDAPHLLPLLSALQRRCRGIAIFDTHVSLESLESYRVDQDLELFGRSIVEHVPQAATAAKPWASWENTYSFWPTERSLSDLLSRAGFPFVVKPTYPYFDWPWKDRDFYIACSRELMGSVASPVYTLPRKPPNPEIEGRLSHHPMLDEPDQRSARNPATRHLGE